MSTNNYNSVHQIINSSEFDVIDNRGYTPLVYAASVGLVQIIKLILNNRKHKLSEIEEAIKVSKENYFFDVAKELENHVLRDSPDSNDNPEIAGSSHAPKRRKLE